MCVLGDVWHQLLRHQRSNLSLLTSRLLVVMATTMLAILGDGCVRFLNSQASLQLFKEGSLPAEFSVIEACVLNIHTIVVDFYKLASCSFCKIPRPISSMAAGVVPSANSSILEVLNLYNYEDWSLRVETYLIAEGLWVVVEATAETPNNGETKCREWRMKNAKALHAIQISCRTDVLGFIRGIRLAKDAWETLAKRLKPKNTEERKEILSRKDKFGNNMLHVVGKWSPLTQIAHIRGAALQMQYELQWFKKVERMASHKDLNCINSDGLTPREVFTINHRNLVEAGEKSMKETAKSCTTVVALVVTIMFAAAFTVPGGNNEDTGAPMFLKATEFMVFIVSDAISLFSSTTSVMIFLGILTSRYKGDDFLKSLPTKMILGLFTLFLSVVTMMVTFSAALYIMLHGKLCIIIPVILLSSVPIASFLWMQFPFLLEIIISTYGLSFRQKYRRLKWWAWRLKGWAWRLKRWARRIYRRF
ncbi:hypothetical protein ACLB2K_061556 [Fragaria x ananassa]